MTKRDGKPCVKCGESDWDKVGRCMECARERSRQWVRENPERHRQRSRHWRQQNPDKYQEYNRSWEAENPEVVRESKRRWKRNNPEKNRESAKRRYHTERTTGGSHTTAEWKALCDQYDNCCACCGEKKKLTIDHVVPVTHGGSNDISNIQPLCQPCNSKKYNKTIDYRTKPGIKRWVQDRLFD